MCSTSKTIQLNYFPTQIFGRETCKSCGFEAELVRNDVGNFRWRCRPCGQSWVEVGSVMGIFNDIHYETFPDRYEGF